MNGIVKEQSFATGRIGVPPVPSGETPDLPKYDFLGSKKWEKNRRDAEGAEKHREKGEGI